MSLTSVITGAAYRLTGSVSFRISSMLPARLHAGKRACRALQDLRDAPSGPYFMRAVLESRWRSRLMEGARRLRVTISCVTAIGL